MNKSLLLGSFLILNFCFIQSESSRDLPFKKVIIWGHKLGTHTHSYIHYAFHKTFKYLGYDTYWFDNSDNISDFDFSNSLFITEGQVDQEMPIDPTSRYILHNCDDQRYKKLLANGDAIVLQVYVHDCLLRNVKKVEPFIYYDLKDKIIFMPWATDLLPHEIDEIKVKIPNFKKENTVYWIGTIGGGIFGNIDQIERFKSSCQTKNITFKHISCTPEQNIDYIQRSIIAPALQGEWQCKQGYIPCRIFKNISRGQMGVTNSKSVSELFENKIVYNEDTKQLFYDAQDRIQNMKIEELYDLMDFVKTKHTYINRINNLLDFLNLVKPINNYNK